MMINKRLIDTVKNSKKYIACNVISQWVSLAVNIIIMGLIAKMLQALSVGTVEERQIMLTGGACRCCSCYTLFKRHCLKQNELSFFKRSEENTSSDDISEAFATWVVL